MSRITEARRGGVSQTYVVAPDGARSTEEQPRAIDPAELMRSEFDAAYYRETYPDISLNDLDPFDHFAEYGWREGRNPTPWFSTQAYVEYNPDAAEYGWNPFDHYLQYGRAEGRTIAAPRLVVLSANDSGSAFQLAETDGLALMRAAFDRDYYCETYPDIEANGLDAFDHFRGYGWREGRDPSSWFSVRHYAGAHRDVTQNPFEHYLLYGKDEGRRIWPASFACPRELEIDPQVSLVTEQALRDLVRYVPSTAAPRSRTYNPARMRIHWVVPEFSEGGGGHMTIFRMVRWLEIFGHECTIWIHNPAPNRRPEDAYDTLVKHFQTVRASVLLLDDDFLQAEGDCVIATGWDTVQCVAATTGFAAKFYFVQDFEPSFFATGSLSLSAEMSYFHTDIACICASPWLSGMMQRQYQRWSRHFWLAYDHSIYLPTGPETRNGAVPRIALYARSGTPRRAVELGLLALELLADRGLRFQVDLFGQDFDVVSARFPATVHGILDAERLASLYRSADIGICFSATNYSLVPQEMMACGLPVVELAVESTRAIYPEGTVALAHPTPLAIAADIERLVLDGDARRQQAERAMAWVGQFSWESSARIVEGALNERLTQLGHTALKAEKSSRASRPPKVVPKVSVCIPTFNGGELLLRVIEQIKAQRTPWPFELLVIDSSSSDGSFEQLQKLDFVRAMRISKAEFGHGRTRNLLASLSRGEFVAYLTQDAMPVDENWLYNLVSLLEHFPSAAGAFGRHVAYPQASPFTKRDLQSHFAGFQAGNIAVSRDTDPLKWCENDVAWRRSLHFYSDNNSCLRRAVWESFPYPNIAFGEDQAWAEMIIKAGFQKLYAPGAAVFHSHDYDPPQAEFRSFEESAFFKQWFGYRLYDEALTFEAQLGRMNDFDRAWARKNRLEAVDLKRRLADNEARLVGLRRGAAS